MIGTAIHRYFAIAAASAALLLYEVAITRVLSVVLWYHFAFLSVSLALLGLGVPGIWFSRFPPRRGVLTGSLLAAGITIPASIVAITQGLGRFHRGDLVGDAATSFGDSAQASFLGLEVVFTVVVLLIPFLALGSSVCLLLLRAPGRSIGTMYGADLLGATLGAAFVVPLLDALPTPSLIAATGLLPLGAAALLAPRRVVWAVGIAVVLLASLLHGEAYRLTYTKKYREGGRLLHEKWTPTGRIAVFPDVFHLADPSEAFAWGFGSRFEPRPVEQLWLEQDGSAGSPITKWTGTLEAMDHLLYDVTSLGYQVRPVERACVIGAGGGRDVLTALRCGATGVEAVELNRHIIDVVSGPFREYSGDVYRLPGVRPVAREGRSHLTRSSERYDLIQVSMVDSWAATAAGAYSLSENFLYTTEAFRLYWRRLTETGIVSISRWFLDRHLVETARLVLLAKSALRREGIGSPESHLVVVHAGAVATLLVSKPPFSEADYRRIDEVCAERGFTRAWPPLPSTPRQAMIPRLLTQGPGALASTGLDLSPPTDDRPFFFQTVPILGRVDAGLVARLSVNEQSVVLLRQLIAVVLLLAGILFFLPFAVWRGRRRAPGFWTGSLYFAGIGLAFLFVEISWIHRFILYLGHPSYATTVVLAAMLLGAGAGSLTASRVPVDRVRRSGLALPAVVAGVGLALPPIFAGTLGWPLPGRVAISLVLLLPPSFLMGFPFPVGMIRFPEENRAWFWAMNGAFSVVASVTSLALSMIWGYALVGMTGAVLYLGVWGLLGVGRITAARAPL
jgi:hypothetical protein